MPRRKRTRSFLEGTFIEKVFYETKPVICMGAAAYMLKAFPLSQLGQVSAMLLFGCGALITIERLRYRGFLK